MVKYIIIFMIIGSGSNKLNTVDCYVILFLLTFLNFNKLKNIQSICFLRG